MTAKYYYNSILKKTVSVFGTVFNNISVGKRSGGKLKNVSRVPIAYGPRAKWLDRINTDPAETKVAIKVPRMSFQVTSLNYDATSKLNTNLNRNYPVEGGAIQVREGVPYKVSFELVIYSKNQDDCLQIVEQILPLFTPEYTVSVKGMSGPDVLTDVPIILTSATPGDEFEGELTTRRLVTYTLTFDVRVKFTAYDPFGDGPSGLRKYIKWVDVNFHTNMNTEESTPVDKLKVELGDYENDTPENYTVVTTFGFDDE